MAAMTKPTIAVLGASGDSAGWALASALLNGHSCRALARNPTKLTNLMLGRGVSQKILDHNLAIVKGNAKNKDDVKNLLLDANRKTVDRVLFGVGGQPQLAWTWSLFTIDDEHVCEISVAALLKALAELAQDGGAGPRPELAVISTTGITSGPRDVPLLFLGLYHWLLAKPHQDKRNMEALLKATKQGNPAQTGLAAATIVRASLLIDGEGRGLESIRQGTEERPTVGYTIARKDVGIWIYEKLLSGRDSTWSGETVTLTN